MRRNSGGSGVLPALGAALLAAAVGAAQAAGPEVGDPGSPGKAAGALPTPARAGSPTMSDSADLHRSARDAQARFERLRLRHLPRVGGTTGGRCDEQVGRLCWWEEAGDWVPTPESAELGALREDLLATLDSVARLLPGDDWVAGQRVWYRGEGGAWDEALDVTRRCEVTGWWCQALRGLALHGSGRFGEAGEAFDQALAAMEEQESRRWRFPERAVDGQARGVLEAARRGEGALSGHLLQRLWLLADPLWLVPGNDRETAHYARWTVSTIRVGARNPYGLSWGRDLEELTVRHGWVLGWERGWPRIGGETDVLGHTHPEGREFLAPGSAVLDPASAPPEALVPDRTRPRSLYAPSYAPLFLPMEGQVAVFPRAGEMAVVATHFLPEDTSWHRSHQHGRPWLEPGDQAGRPERAGLFLTPVGPALALEDGALHPVGHGVPRDRGVGTVPPPHRALAVDPPEHGALVVQAPAGRYLLSVERWSPEARRAGRWRRGLAWEATPPDVATLSDLLLVAEGSGEPATLADAARVTLPRPRVPSGEPFGIVWEVGGVGWRSEAIRYTLTLRGAGGNLLQRAGRWLGLLGEDEPLRLSWEEDAPERPGRMLRHLEVDPGALEEGRYSLLLEARVQGRAPLRSERTLWVAPGGSQNAR